MKNQRTPRTLADCDFSVGYPVVRPREPWIVRALPVALALVAFAAIGVILAWRG